jgi:di/tricarboxylate transporter
MQSPEFTLQIAMVLSVVFITVVLFITEWLRVDVVAILVMVALPLLGLIDGRETFQGLSSTAVISIIAVIIMGRGLDHTGVISRGVRPLMRLAGDSRSRIILLLSGTVAVISSFMQNVGAAALFLPAIQRISRKSGIPISHLLMPIGFSAILGGTISLVGSSPLIMLNDLLRPFNVAPFSLFDVTPAGIALVATGIVYFLVAGKFVLPARTGTDETKEAANADPLIYYPELVKLFELAYPRSERGEEPKVLELCDRYNVHTVGLSLDGGKHKILPPDRDLRISPGSVFAAYGSPEHIEQLAEDFNLDIKYDLDVFKEDLSDEISGVVEAIVSPHSRFVGKTLIEIRFRHNHLMAPLAIIHQGEIHYNKLGPRLLEPGDVILMHGRWESFQRMRPKRDLLFAQSPDHEIIKPQQANIALACFALATGLVIFTSLPISVCLMTGALGMILTGVLRIDEAYQGVDWRTVFLLSGLIPLGIAMQETNAATWLAHHLLRLIGTPTPALFFFIIGLLTMLLTLVVSNVGAAVLLVPLVVDMAGAIGVDPRLAALVVGLAASNSFILPTHQVNALYMGPGGYTSRDYIKAGAPLSVLFLVVLTAVMMVVY